MWSRKQSEERRAALDTLKESLKIPDDDPHVDVSQYQRLLGRAFSDHISLIEPHELMSWDQVSGDPVVSDFLQAKSSRVLVISGRNHEKVNDTTLSWLSFGALSLIQDNPLLISQASVSGYFFCQTRPTLPQTHRPLFKDVLATWVYQLVASQGSLSYSRLDGLKKVFMDSVWNSDVHDALSGVASELYRLLDGFNDDAVIQLVLDRADQCRLEMDPERYAADLTQIVHWLIKLAQKSPRVLKVVVVLSPVMDGLTVYRQERLAAMESGVYTERLGWDQAVD